VIASTKTDNRTMECAGVDSGAKILVDVLLSAPERVSGIRKNTNNSSDDAVSAQGSERLLTALVMKAPL